MNQPAIEAQVHAGFGKASLWGTWKTDRKLADEIDVRILAVRSGDTTAAVAVTDLQCLFPSVSIALRDAIARALNTPPEQVAVFATQNHGTPAEDSAYDHQKLQDACVQAARMAGQAMRPVQVAAVTVHPKLALNVCRRVKFEDFGAFTFWFGYRLDEGQRAYNSHLLKLALNTLAKGEPMQTRCFYPKTENPESYEVPDSPRPVPEPSYMPAANDDAIQALFFRDMEGRPVGSMLRYAAHAATANRGDVDWLSGDYPAYVRRALEEKFGGMSVFMSGPCGDQATLCGRKSLETAQRVGGQLAEQALAALPTANWWHTGSLTASSPQVTLHARKEITSMGREQAAVRRDEVAAQIRQLAQQKAPLVQIKRLTDQYEMLDYLATRYQENYSGLDLKKQPTVHHPLFVMRLGPVAIAGLPGEPFGQYSAELRRRTGGDNLIVVDECNGYLGYIPMAADYPDGSYGVNSAHFGPETEGALLDTLVKALNEKLPSTGKAQ